MPEVFREEGFVFFFYSNEGNEPVHIHVRRGDGYAKFWIEPLGLSYSCGLKTSELSRAEELVSENLQMIVDKWHETFGQ